MEQLSLSSSLKLKDPAVISFYGAGGKTTLMLRLAEELAAAKANVVVTTTTKIYKPSDLPLTIAPTAKEALTNIETCFNSSNLAVLGSRIDPEGKLQGIDPGMIAEIFTALKSFVLVEADGASRKPLKGYEHYEPVLPPVSAYAIAVAGADVLGQEIGKRWVHRPDKFTAATGIGSGELITGSVLAQAYQYMYAKGKDQTPEAKFIAILNKADLLNKPEETALDLAASFTENEISFQYLLLAAARHANPVNFIIATASKPARTHITALVLAAGLASRMGKDKLTLKLGGSTVFERTLKTVMESGADQIIVVTRPGSDLIHYAEALKCKVVVNPSPETGLSSSLKVGLNSVAGCSQGVLFSLADQPLIPAHVYRALIERYRKTLKPITCPLYRGKRGNPVIFDRRLWPDLAQVEGDQGGRSLIDSAAEGDIDYLPVDDPSVIVDLDTPQDYTRLLCRDLGIE